MLLRDIGGPLAHTLTECSSVECLQLPMHVSAGGESKNEARTPKHQRFCLSSDPVFREIRETQFGPESAELVHVMLLSDRSLAE